MVVAPQADRCLISWLLVRGATEVRDVMLDMEGVKRVCVEGLCWG